MSTIEELKRRRLESRERGQTLDDKRDQTIMRI
jgi:hypothetical protein